MRLDHKVAIITGASSGIGRASALLFAKEGARVVIADLDRTGGEETVSAITANQGEAIFVATDVTNPSDLENIISQTMAAFSRIDILFNNAGIYMKQTPVEDLEDSLWDRIYSVNVKGIFLGVRAVVPVMKKAGGGTIINTASMAAVRPGPRLSAYSSSKGAVITLTKALATELAPYHIRVNCICPTLTDTPMIANSPERQMAMANPGPFGRMAIPDDVALAALYLASEESSIISGISLKVNGGQV